MGCETEYEDGYYDHEETTYHEEYEEEYECPITMVRFSMGQEG